MRALIFARGQRLILTATAALAVLCASAIAATLPADGQARVRPASAGAAFHSRLFVNGSTIMHATPGGSQPVSDPDDLTTLGGRIFTAFQNGVGPQGQAGTGGTRDSTVVEFTRTGHEVGQWDVTGKCDGLTADPATGRVIVTVNEDAHSSLYLLDPAGTGTVTHYHYSAPVASKGGTDAIDIYHGMVLISGSAPGTTGKGAPQASYPAVYVAHFSTSRRTVALTPLFSDEATAQVANAGQAASVKLALTDPDSNATVPAWASRFAGDFELTSQGDEEQIFVSHPGTSAQKLEVLKLDGSFDDAAWPSSASGTLYVTDNAANRIDAITGPFQRGEEIASETPCDADDAPSTCPAANFPANYLTTLNPMTGTSTAIKLTGTKPAAQSLLFVP